MAVLAGVTSNDLYQDCDSRFWGICALCELPPHRHGLDGQQDMGGRDGRTERVGMPFPVLLPVLLPLLFQGTEGETCLFGLIRKDGTVFKNRSWKRDTERGFVY